MPNPPPGLSAGVNSFWRHINSYESGVLLLVFLDSWKRIGDQFGIEAVDIAENVFTGICRFATRDAVQSTQLSMTLFGAYWLGTGPERYAIEVLERWLPMQISSGDTKLPIVGSWLRLDRVNREPGHDLYRRAQAGLEAQVRQLPASDRHTALSYSWQELMQD
jgi:hypothetical protein